MASPLSLCSFSEKIQQQNASGVLSRGSYTGYSMSEIDPQNENASKPTPSLRGSRKPDDLERFTGSESELIVALRQISGDIGLQGVPEDAWPLLAKYCQLVWDWNEKLNLTRHTTPELFVKRDLLDSVRLAALLRPDEEVLDIGTGGGVPGILVAILRPDIQVTLCDSVAKKAKVAQEIVDRLGLEVPVYPISLIKVLEEFRYDTVFARGVGPLERLCTWLRNEWHKIGRLLAIKGPRWVDERGEARHRGLLKGVDLRRLVSYTMPDTDSESVILQLSRQMGAKEVDEA